MDGQPGPAVERRELYSVQYLVLGQTKVEKNIKI